MTKPQFFDSVSSPVPIGDKENKKNKSKNIAADWQRLSTEEKAYFNGKPISAYASQYNSFNTESDVDQFIDEQLYPELALPADSKEKVLTYLRDYFNQQGFMLPVSTTISYTLMEAGEDADGIGLTISNNDYIDHYINISADATGLSIQEFVEVKKLTYSKGKDAGKFTADLPKKDYVIKAEGTVLLNFRNNPSDPDIDVKSNNISVGHSMLKPLFTPDTFMAKLWDFIMQILGRNKAELYEPPKNSSGPK